MELWSKGVRAPTSNPALVGLASLLRPREDHRRPPPDPPPCVGCGGSKSAKPETKSVVGKFRSLTVSFNPNDHPRDWMGRFIDAPDVHLPDGTDGVAVAAADGKVDVETPDGAVLSVPLADVEVDAPQPPNLDPAVWQHGQAIAEIERAWRQPIAEMDLHPDALESRLEQVKKHIPLPVSVIQTPRTTVIVNDKTKGDGGRRTKKLPFDRLQHIHDVVEWLHDVHPLQHTDEAVIAIHSPHKWDDGDWFMATMRGADAVRYDGENPSPHGITVNHTELVDGDWTVDDLNRVLEYRRPTEHGKGSRMRVKAEVGDSEYSLTHEWGHAHDYRTDAQKDEDMAAFTDSPLNAALSSYGRTNTHEAYAEAYAEWILSEGKTTNAAARWFANKYDWPIPTHQRQLPLIPPSAGKETFVKKVAE